MHKWLKFGLERSGTNYLGDLIALNFKAEEVEHYLDGYWKHGVLVRPLGQEYDTIIITKNIYSWLFSIHYLFKLKFDVVARDFSDFLRQPIDLTFPLWPTEITRTLKYDNPVDMWNKRIGHWLDVELQTSTKVVVSYEELLSDYEKTLLAVEAALGFERRNEALSNISEECGPNYIKKNPTGDFNRNRYYLDAEYMADYSADDLGYVNALVDRTVMDRLGYKVFKRFDDIV